MYGIFTYICAILGVNVGKYCLHGAIDPLHFWGPYGGYYYAEGLVHICKFLLVDTLPQSMESHKITLW